MKISYNWLKWYLPELEIGLVQAGIPEIPDAKKLQEVLTYHLTEVESVSPLRYSGEGAGGEVDYIFDINILPNRAHDLLSHSGVARELAGQLGIKFNDPRPTESSGRATPMYKIPKSEPTKLEIKIETEKCRRFSARIVRNIKVGSSPDWVVKHLESIGQRSINNIVDATNIVMYDCGQPTHAFDFRKFAPPLTPPHSNGEGKNPTIIICNAQNDQELKLVGRDGIIAKLKNTDVVIANSDDEVLSLAGIKGGVNSGIQDDTTDLILEVANFDPTSIRKTARRIGILSDSAKRFENNLSPELCSFAMLELSGLILEMCPDAVFEEVVDNYPEKEKWQVDRKIIFKTEQVNKKLGSSIKNEEIEKILINYGYNYEFKDGVWEITVPKLRLDLENVEDMVEEIGRIYGYDKIVPSISKISFVPKNNETYEKIRTVRNDLISKGYREVMTYSFINVGDVEVLASASDKNFLRTNLTDGLKKSYELNKLNASFLGLNEIKIFEIGNVFTKPARLSHSGGKSEEMRVAYLDKKEIKEMNLDDYIKNNSLGFNFDNNSSLPTDRQVFKFSNFNFKTWSAFPFISRDIAMWVPKNTDINEILDIIKANSGVLLVREPQLFDKFEKGEKVSYAWHLVFQSFERNLTDLEVVEIMKNITKKIEEQGFILR